MALTFSRATRCHTEEDEEMCLGCSWKCDCIACSTNGAPEEHECQCTCRFWIVVCCVVVLGFLALFLSAVAYRRRILYFLSAGAVLYAGSLAALTIFTDNCALPAFFSITMVFAFPCFYSCCWNYQTARNLPTVSGPPTGMNNPQPTTNGAPGRMETKPTSAVVMLFPDGDMQLGVRETEMQERSESFADPSSSEHVRSASLPISNQPNTSVPTVTDGSN